jgi:hypothetical protein
VKTVATSGAGSLQIALGANTPGGGSFTAPAGGVAMMQVLLTASSLEDVTVSRVRVTSLGTGDESSGVTARIFEDGDGDGTVSSGDSEIGSASFSQDNGAAEFTGLGLTVPAAGAVHLLLVYDFDGSASAGTYIVSIEAGEALEAQGTVSQLGVIAEGAPLSGPAQEVIFVPHTEATYFMGGCAAGGTTPAHWAGYLLLLVTTLAVFRRRTAKQR